MSQPLDASPQASSKRPAAVKRHCMVVFAHYPGSETRVQRQTELLLREGFEVDVLCLRDMGREAPEEVVNGATVFRLAASRSYGRVSFARLLLEYFVFFLRAMVALIRLHPRRGYATVQVHNLPDFLIFAAWFPKVRGARLILDLHDLMPEFFAARTGRPMSSWLVRLIALQERLSCAFADHVITVTETWRSTLVERGTRPDKASVVMNVADDRVFRRTARSRPSPNGHGFHLFYHGAIVPRYGIDLLLEAVARLRNELPGLHLTIHGSGGGDFREQLAQLARQRGIADQVRFSEKVVPMSELPELISTADVALVPNRRDIFTDGILPTKLLEYTAVGVPAIVARTPAIAAYFDDSMVQFFAPGDVEDLAQCIRTLYSDRRRLTELAQNTEKFNLQFNWQKVGAGYLALLQSLAGR